MVRVVVCTYIPSRPRRDEPEPICVVSFSFLFFFNRLVHFAVEASFILSGLLLDKPWSQVSSLFPPPVRASIFCRA